MSLFEQLKNKYPSKALSLYGDCLIIPTKEFEKEWEKQLQEEGHAVRVTESEYRTIYAVSIQKKIPFAPKEPFPEPPKQEEPKKITEPMKEIVQHRAKGGNKWLNVWQPNEDKLLIELWNKTPRLTVQQITTELQKTYPNRTLEAVGNRISALQAEGQIQPRWHTKRKTKPEPAAEPGNKPMTQTEFLTEIKTRMEALAGLIVQNSNENLERISNLEQDLKTVISTMNGRIDDIDNNLHFLTDDFKEHEHSDKTGLPRVPP